MSVRKKFAIGCFSVLLLVGVGLLGLYWASKHVPEAYRKATEVEPARQRQASDQMLQRAAALAGDVKKGGRWEAAFTAEEINGWLAVDLVQNHPDALPEQLSDPRLAIEPDRMMLFCRARWRGMTSVITLTVEPYVAKPNVLALRIRKARAGALPVPLTKILEAISKAVERMEYHLQWQYSEGDPVALILIPPPRDGHDKVVQIETLELGQGEIILSGVTERRKAEK